MNHSLRKFYAFLLPLFLFLIHLPFVFANVKHDTKTAIFAETGNRLPETNVDMSADLALYTSLKLQQIGLSQQAFINAVKGYYYLYSQGKLNNDGVLSIVDFSLPSSKERLFVIDLDNDKLLYKTFVAHGRNSGTKYAREFSNRPESYKSSLGFYITRNTYQGQHGYSLRLEGEEEGINDNAMSRAIVMHSAEYVNQSLVKTQGYIGRSLGCPALPPQVYRPIIQKIKDGSCLFMYSPDARYEQQSKILKLAS